MCIRQTSDRCRLLLKSSIAGGTLFLFLMTAFVSINALAGEVGSTKGETPPPLTQVLFSNVNIFDGNSDKLQQNMHVLVSGNKISEISAEPLAVIQSTNMKVIDAQGRTLMPGLIDAHVHLNLMLLDNPKGIVGANDMTWEDMGAVAASSAKEYLMMGFTTVRDMGGMADGFKRAIDKGLIEGPRIYPAGAYIAQTSGHGDLRLRGQPNPQISGVQYSNLERLGITRIADGVANVQTAVRENFANGAVYIKLHAGGGISSEKDPLHTIQYTMEELKAADTETRNWDTYFTVHAYTSPTVNRVLDAGAQAIDHGQMVDEATMKRMGEQGTFLTSNMAGISKDLMKHPLYGNPKNPQYIKTKQFQEGSKNFAKWAKQYNVKWSFGDDLVLSTQTYFRQHLDYEKWFVGDLFGNHFALVGMTSMPGQLAQLTGKTNPYPGKLGVIEEGAYADILVVDGNPLEDMAAIGADKAWFDAPPRSQNIPSIRVIMKDGKIYKNTLSSPNGPKTGETQQNLDALLEATPAKLADNAKYPELHFCLHDH